MISAPLRRAFYGAARGSGLLAWLRWKRRRHVPILFYHGVTEDSRGGVVNCEGKHLSAAAFERQLRFISRHCRAIPLSRYAESLRGGAPLEDHSVVLSFDDGYANNFSTAYPLLKKYGIPAAFHLTADFVEKGEPLWFDRLEAAFSRTGRKTWKNPAGAGEERLDSDRARIGAYLETKRALKRLPPAGQQEMLGLVLAELGAGEADLPPLFSPMTPDQVRELARSGLIEIGSHACRHLPLTALAPGEARAELSDSKKRLAGLAGADVAGLAYPNGEFSPEIKRLAEETGYSHAVTTVLRLNAPRAGDPYSLSRVALAETDGEAEIAATLCGLRQWALARRGLLPS